MTGRLPQGEEAPPSAIQVSFEGGEDVPILFVNNLFVRLSPDGFLSSFAQSHGPYILGLTPEQAATEGISARVVSRLAIPANRMKEFLDILNTVFEQNVRSIPIADVGANDDANESVSQ